MKFSGRVSCISSSSSPFKRKEGWRRKRCQISLRKWIINEQALRALRRLQEVYRLLSFVLAVRTDKTEQPWDIQGQLEWDSVAIHV